MDVWFRSNRRYNIFMFRNLIYNTMITNFNNYINEGFIKKEIELKDFLEDFLKKNNYNNIITFNHKRKNNYCFLCDRNSVSYNNNRILCNFATIELTKGNLYHIVDKNFYFFNNFNNRKELKVYLTKYLQSYYTNLLSIKDKKFELENVPVLNNKKYNDFIVKLINSNPEYIKDKNIFMRYLDNEHKQKINHIINANNFDLV